MQSTTRMAATFLQISGQFPDDLQIRLELAAEIQQIELSLACGYALLCGPLDLRGVTLPKRLNGLPVVRTKIAEFPGITVAS